MPPLSGDAVERVNSLKDAEPQGRTRSHPYMSPQVSCYANIGTKSEFVLYHSPPDSIFELRDF
jgi:hypothetical protein